MKEGKERILVIDSDLRFRRDLARFLGDEFDVETGRNLSEAIRKVPSGAFRCLILDVDLPEMKGYEAVPVMKNLDPALKVIMTTRRNSKRLEAKVREQDIFFYFIKPFGKEELRMAIHNALAE